jgi:hypothetical protein
MRSGRSSKNRFSAAGSVASKAAVLRAATSRAACSSRSGLRAFVDAGRRVGFVAGRRGAAQRHSPSQTIAFVSELQDIADAQAQRCALPVGVILADCEPRWLTTVRRWFGR